MTALDFAMMVEDSHVETRLIEYRQRGPDSFITGRGEGSPDCRRADGRAFATVCRWSIRSSIRTLPRAASARS